MMLSETNLGGQVHDLVLKLLSFLAVQGEADRASILGFLHLASATKVSTDLQLSPDGQFTLTMRGVDQI